MINPSFSACQTTRSLRAFFATFERRARSSPRFPIGSARVEVLSELSRGFEKLEELERREAND